jgi:branched-chain amino acid transport system substrate-binding protein
MKFGAAVRVGVAALAVAVGLAACSSSSKNSTASSGAAGSSGSSGSNGAAIKIGLMDDLSGPIASTFSPVKAGVTAFVDYYNAHGGLYGHHLDLSVYDDASSPSQTLANARLAVANGDQVLVGQEYLLSSAVPYIQSQNVPFFGFGLTPNFFGADKLNFFSFVGNLITAATNTLYKYVIQEQHYTNISLVSDSAPANAETMPALKQIVLSMGATVPYTNYAVDDTNSASLLALAEKLKSTDTQFVYTNFLGYAAAQLQADLTQIGSKIVVATGIIGFDQQVPKQFGSAANGLEATLFSASWVNPDVPGVQTYESAMSQYQPAQEYNQQALYGWDAMVNLGGVLQILGSKPPTRANIVTAGNTLTGFTGNGILQPVNFPAFHTEPALCDVIGQLQGGTWKSLTGTSTNPFYCGEQFTG